MRFLQKTGEVSGFTGEVSGFTGEVSGFTGEVLGFTGEVVMPRVAGYSPLNIVACPQLIRCDVVMPRAAGYVARR